MSDWDDVDEDLLLKAVETASKACTMTQASVLGRSQDEMAAKGGAHYMGPEGFQSVAGPSARTGQNAPGPSYQDSLEIERMLQEVVQLRQQLRDQRAEFQKLRQHADSLECAAQQRRHVAAGEESLKKEIHDLKVQLTFQNEEFKDVKLLREELKHLKSQNLEMEKNLLQQRKERVNPTEKCRGRPSNGSIEGGREMKRARSGAPDDACYSSEGGQARVKCTPTSMSPMLFEASSQLLEEVWRHAHKEVHGLRNMLKEISQGSYLLDFTVDLALLTEYASNLDNLLLKSKSYQLIETSLKIIMSMADEMDHSMGLDVPNGIEIPTYVVDILAGVVAGSGATWVSIRSALEPNTLSDLVQGLVHLWRKWGGNATHRPMLGNSIIKLFGILGDDGGEVDITPLLTCGLLGAGLRSGRLLSQVGALDVFSALEISRGIISGGNTDAHNEAIVALLECVFPSKAGQPAKSSMERSRWGMFESHRKGLSLVAWLVKKKETQKIHMLLGINRVEGFYGVIPRIVQLLHHTLLGLCETSQAVTHVNMRTSSLEKCREAMEQVRLLLEGLTLIQGIMRMPSTEVLVLGNIASSTSLQECFSSVCWTVESLDDNCLSVRGCQPLLPERWVAQLWSGAVYPKQSSSSDCIRIVKKLGATIWGRWKTFRARNIHQKQQ